MSVICWLVVWNMNFMFPNIVGNNNPNLTNSYFSQVGQVGL